MNKLYNLLLQLDEKELSRLELYLSSPYFVTSPYPQQLFSFLKSVHPDYKKWDKTTVANAVFSDRKQDRKFINSRYSELSRVIEDFLAMEYFKKDPDLRDKARREAFAAKQLYTTFKGICKKQLRAMGKPKDYASSAYLKAFEIYTDLYGHPYRIAHDSGEQTFYQMTHQLDLFFISEKLKQLCDHYAQHLTYQRPAHFRMEEVILQEAAHFRQESLQIDLFYQLAEVFQLKLTEELLEDILQTYLHKGHQLQRDDQAFFLQKLVSILNYKLNRDQKYVPKLFALYQYGDKENLFLLNDKITDSTFLNVCTVGGFQQEFTWTHQFIKRNHKYLFPKTQREASLLGQAIVLFHQGLYKKAFDLLQEIPQKGMHYKLRIRTLTVRCVLAAHIAENNYRDTVLDSIEAFRQFLKREKTLSAARKKQYRAFCSMARKLALIRILDWNNPEVRSAFRSKLEAQKTIVLKPWLLKLLNESGQSKPY